MPLRPLRRSSTDAVLGGVCAGVAIRLGVRERTIRVAFAVSAFLFGLGLLVYVASWLFMTRSGEEQSIGQRLSSRRRESRIILLSVIVALFLLLAVHSLYLNFGGFAWAVLFSAVAILGIWRGSSPDERIHLQGLLNAAPIVGTASSRGWKAVAVRVIPGVVLVVLGLRIMNQIGGGSGEPPYPH